MRAGGGAAALGLAGCLGDGGSPNTDTETEEDTEAGTEAGTEDGGTDEPQEDRGGQLDVVQSGQPPDWDAVLGLGGPSQLVGKEFFSALYTYDQDLNLIPDDLATGMPEIENDGTRYVVEIVEGAEFHDGNPITAEDVQYSFQAPLDEGSWAASSWNMIEEMELIDDRTIQFDLEFSYGPFPSALGSAWIVSKEAREPDPQAFGQDPVGSGPFRLEDWQEGEFARIVKWDDYWGERVPLLDEVEYVPVTEDTTRITEFRTNAHLLQTIPPRLYETVAGIENAEIHEKAGLQYTFLTFNLNKGETTKPEVREAIDYCFDMDQIVERYAEPANVRQYHPIPIPTFEAWDMPTEEFESMAVGKDIDRAQQLFEEADVPDDWECVILCPPDDTRENKCVTVANGIKEAGYEARVDRFDWGTYLDKFTTGEPSDYNLYSLGWSVNPDPDYQMYNMYHIQGAGANHGHYWEDEEVMDTIEEARRATERDRRRELYIEIQKEVVSQRVQIPAWNGKEMWGRKNVVKDYQLSSAPSQNPRLNTHSNRVWIDE